jgi:two-component system, NarL family, nitrate/nitrite response regulator NarL
MRSRGDLVLVVDDDADCCALIRRLCEQAGYRVLDIPSGEEALEAVQRELPAVILMNVRLPGVSGYEICRELRDRFGEALPIVFMSEERTEPFDIAGGLLIGADDYIVRPFHPDELLARLRRFVARSEGIKTDLAATLTSREREVLRLLASGLRQDQVASELSISTTTVATHIQRILGKLGVHSRAQAVALAHRSRLADPER